MKNQKTIKLVESHGRTIKGIDIHISTPRCIALFDLLQRAEHEYMASEEFTDKHGVTYDATDYSYVKQAVKKDPVLAALKTLEAYIAPVLSGIELNTSQNTVDDIMKESRELMQVDNE